MGQIILLLSIIKISLSTKYQIRQNVFETNSSSTHSMVLMPIDKYKDWKNGKLKYNPYLDDFKCVEDANEYNANRDKYDTYSDIYLTMEGFYEGYLEYASVIDKENSTTHAIAYYIYE